jgi:hypothetical protein
LPRFWCPVALVEDICVPLFQIFFHHEEHEGVTKSTKKEKSFPFVLFVSFVVSGELLVEAAE